MEGVWLNNAESMHANELKVNCHEHAIRAYISIKQVQRHEDTSSASAKVNSILTKTHFNKIGSLQQTGVHGQQAE